MAANQFMGPIDFIDVFFLLPLFIVGIIASYTDIKYGKIFNRLIVGALLYGAGLIIVLFFYNAFFLRQPENFIYLSKVCLNAALALIIGYFLWQSRFWSAGDAKLFAVYALLLPLKFYDNSYVNYFPSFNLLINLFFPVLIILVFYTLKDFWVSKWKFLTIKQFSSAVNSVSKGRLLIGWVKNSAALFLNFVFFMIAFQAILAILKMIIGREISPHPFLFFFILLFVMEKFNFWKTRIKWFHYFIFITPLIYLSYLIIQSNFSAIWGLVKMALIFMVLVNLARRLLDLYIDRKETLIIKLKDLRQGDLVRKEDLNKIIDSLDEKSREAFGLISAEGLNQGQAALIKNKTKNRSAEYIRIDKTFPFAPYMLLAAVFSVLTRSSFLVFLQNLFSGIQ